MRLIIESEPIAKARHRSRIERGYIVTYDPQSTQKHRTMALARSLMRESGFLMIDSGPIMMSLINYVKIPQSWSNKKKKLYEGKPCESRPDVDNYLKFYGDVLNEIAYADDRQIARVWSEKLYSSNPRVEITITDIGGDMIVEHAITILNENLSLDQLDYIVKKANQLGLQNRKIYRVYTQDDSEGKHVYFEAEGMTSKKEIDDASE